MKYLLLDKLQRLKAGWIVLALSSLGVGLVLPGNKLSLGKEVTFMNWVCLVGGGMSLAFWAAELGGGYGRVVLTLPFTTRQLARFLWFISVGLQTLIFACFSALGILLRMGASSADELFFLWLQMVVVVGLFLGSSFWITSGSPSLQGGQVAVRYRLGQLAYSIVFFVGIFAFGYWLYHASYSGYIKYDIICLPCMVFTYFGWARAESLLVDYGGYRKAAGEEIKSAGNFRTPSGFGGVRYLWAGAFARPFGWLAAILMFCYLWFQLRHPDDKEFFVFVLPGFLPIIALIFSLIEAARISTIIRYLRSLPISAARLAALFFAVILLPYLVGAAIGVTVKILNSTPPASLLSAKMFWLCLAPLCVLSVAVVWNNENWIQRVAVTMIFVGISGIPAAYEYIAVDPGWPLGFIIVYPLVILAVTMRIVCLLIESNDMTYRYRLQLMIKNG